MLRGDYTPLQLRLSTAIVYVILIILIAVAWVLYDQHACCSGIPGLLPFSILRNTFSEFGFWDDNPDGWFLEAIAMILAGLSYIPQMLARQVREDRGDSIHLRREPAGLPGPLLLRPVSEAHHPQPDLNLHGRVHRRRDDLLGRGPADGLQTQQISIQIAYFQEACILSALGAACLLRLRALHDRALGGRLRDLASL